MMENQREMINDCPLNVPNDGVVATPDDLNGYFSVCVDQKDFCTCSPFDIKGNWYPRILPNERICFYYYDEFVCSFFGRIRGHQKVLSKLSDLYQCDRTIKEFYKYTVDLE